MPLSVHLKSTDPLYDQKCNYWRGDGSLPSRRVRVSVCENENSRILFSMLRIIEADVEDYDRLTSGTGYLNQNNNQNIHNNGSNSGCGGGMGSGSGGRAGVRSYRSVQDAQIPVSVRNEIRVMKHLKYLCDNNLSAYPNSYQNDCIRLLDESSSSLAPFSNERHALIQVKGEKEVLLFYKDFSETVIRLLEIKDDIIFDRELASIWSTKHVVVQQYLTNTACRLRQTDKQRAELRQKNVDFSRPTVV